MTVSKKAFTDYSVGPDGKPKWSTSKHVQEQVKRLNRRTKELQDLATQDLDATALLYQQDEPGFLQPEGPRERTFFITQQALKPQVSLQAQNKMSFSLQLERGPFHLDYTRNGRFMLSGGEGGQFASFDWQAGRLGCQVDLRATGEQNERIRDVCFLQNETMMAVAQANYVYIYDGRGVELHRLKKHGQVKAIEYLPYHFILSSVSDDNMIRWQDTTSGKLVGEFKFSDSTGLATDMCQNPATAIINMSHPNGIVSMWSPNLNKPLVRVSCHKGPVRAVSVNPRGSAMATAGLDGVVKLWDLRHMYRPLGEYRSMRPVSCLSFSQRDLLAAGFGAHVVVWKDTLLAQQDKPYMRHVLEGKSVHRLAFCPYEDVLGVGHSHGIDTLLIPGAGEPNYDIYEANPFSNTRQRQEREVHALLDKLPVETISLDGGQFVGRVNKSAKETIEADRKLERMANRKAPADSKDNEDDNKDNDGDTTNNHDGGKKEKKRARGRSSAMRRYLRKRANVIDKYKEEAAEKARTETIHKNLGLQADSQSGLTALNRFVSRSI